MDQQLIPPPDLAPPSVKHLPLARRIGLWAELVDACDVFLRSGLRSRVGADGDWHSAYRAWCERRMADHERGQIQFLTNLARRETAGGH